MATGCGSIETFLNLYVQARIEGNADFPPGGKSCITVDVQCQKPRPRYQNLHRQLCNLSPALGNLTLHTMLSHIATEYTLTYGVLISSPIVSKFAYL